MSARSALCLALALGAPVVAGCASTPAQSLWRDDFETTCDGTPCGWTQVAGPAGSVVWVDTIAGDHGLQMRGPGVAISRIADGSEPGVFDPVSSLQAHIVARCDPGAQLTLLVTVSTIDATPLDLSGNASFPSTWDGSRSTLPLFVNDSTQVGAQFVDIVSLVLHKEGAGVCEVDYLSLASFSVPFAE